MDEVGMWLLITAAVLAVMVILRRPLGALAKFLARWLAGLAGVWLFDLAGGLIGVHLGVNLFTGLTVGLLGLPGFGLLLLLQCI